MIWQNEKIILSSDVLFETLLVREQRAELVEEHLCRLQQSISVLGFRVQADFSPEHISEFLQKNAYPEKIYRLRLFATALGGKMALEEYQPLDPQLYQQGIKLKRVPHPELSRAAHKYWQRQQYRELHRFALDSGFHEALLCDGNELLETATSNFFMMHDGVVFVPPPGKRLPGVMLQAVLKKFNLPIREEKILWPLPKNAQCYITSSLKKLVPVRQIDEENFLVRKT